MPPRHTPGHLRPSAKQPKATPVSSRRPKPLDKGKLKGRVVLVPTSAVTAESLAEDGCAEHGGRGWSAQITSVKHNACLVKWIAKEGRWHGWRDYYQLHVVMGWEPLK